MQSIKKRSRFSPCWRRDRFWGETPALPAALLGAGVLFVHFQNFFQPGLGRAGWAGLQGGVGFVLQLAPGEGRQGPVFALDRQTCGAGVILPAVVGVVVQGYRILREGELPADFIPDDDLATHLQVVPKPLHVHALGGQLALDTDAAVAGLLPQIPFAAGIVPGFVLGIDKAGNLVEQNAVVDAQAHVTI